MTKKEKQVAAQDERQERIASSLERIATSFEAVAEAVLESRREEVAAEEKALRREKIENEVDIKELEALNAYGKRLPPGTQSREEFLKSLDDGSKGKFGG